MNRGALRSQIESNSLVALAASKILKEEGISGHSKCSKRTNVFGAHDLLVAKAAGQDIDEYANNHGGCPFYSIQGCSLINASLTVPSLCVKRIVAENSALLPLRGRLDRAYCFLKQTVKLVGDKK